MNPQRLIEQMGLNARRIQALAEGVSPAQAVWKPRPTDWSLLEVVNHLYDEEKFDFRVRLDITLHRPSESWPPIDPPGWVTAHGYAQRELGPSLRNFLNERQASLRWLNSLGTTDWNATYAAPWGATMRAGDLLAAWAAHDLLHLRQLVELQYAYMLELAPPYGVGYAGEW